MANPGEVVRCTEMVFYQEAKTAWGKLRITAYNADLVKAWLKPK